MPRSHANRGKPLEAALDRIHKRGAEERKLGVLVSAGLVLLSGQRAPTDAGRLAVREAS